MKYFVLSSFCKKNMPNEQFASDVISLLISLKIASLFFSSVNLKTVCNNREPVLFLRIAGMLPTILANIFSMAYCLLILSHFLSRATSQSSLQLSMISFILLICILLFFSHPFSFSSLWKVFSLWWLPFEGF